MRAGDSWSWSETDFFQVEGNYITLIQKDKSKVVHEHFETE
jgi:hypothetical protein